MLSHLCQKAAKRLRDAGLHARTISLTLRFANFKTITRSRTLAEPTEFDSVLLKNIRELFSLTWNGRDMLRLVGVALTQFSGAPGQMNLLDSEAQEKLKRLAKATDAVRDRFGFSTLQLGGSLSKRPERQNLSKHGPRGESGIRD